MPSILPTIYGSNDLYQSYIDAQKYAFESKTIKQFATSIGVDLNKKKKESNWPITVELKDILNIFPSVGLKKLAQNTTTLLVFCSRKVPGSFLYHELIKKFSFFDAVCNHAGFDKKKHSNCTNALQNNPSVWLLGPVGEKGMYVICGGVLFVPTIPDVYIQFWVWNPHAGSGEYWYHEGEYKDHPEQ